MLFRRYFEGICHYRSSVFIEQAKFLSDGFIELFNSYIINRKFSVEYNNFRSEISNFRCATGFHSWSTLFALYINHILANIRYNVVLFADNLKIYKSIADENERLDLQSDLLNVLLWCQTNKLHLNTQKSWIVSITRHNFKTEFQYKIGPDILHLNMVKDLGVSFDDKLNFNQHILNICNSAIRTLGFIVRNSRDFYDIRTIKVLFFTLIRSKLEYVSSIWSPYYTHLKVCNGFKEGL
ncbi:hypothetical protein BDFB_003799 [Asbolus verrucosus]|uniref:Uncharacterized protein n=1 Tax=Asbolus verrucosus TaxID=1661398 RepID=A0A482VP89_ASBVE|nr:hypothetical protein BDFB_003799 [Asbolus verrucosus]